MPATAARKKPEHDAPRTPPGERAAGRTTEAPHATPPAGRRSRVATGDVSARRASPSNRTQHPAPRRDPRAAGTQAASAATSPHAVVIERRRNPRAIPGHAAQHSSATFGETLLDETLETLDEARPRAAPTRRARHSLRRAHRPFRLSPTVAMASVALLLQLVALLWLKGLALTARNRADVLDRKITAISGEIANTEDNVAKLSSPPRLRQWAEELGMRPVTQVDIDDVRQRTPWPANALPSGSSPPGAPGVDTPGVDTAGGNATGTSAVGTSAVGMDGASTGGARGDSLDAHAPVNAGGAAGKVRQDKTRQGEGGVADE